MKMKKIVSLILAGCMLFTTPVMAKEVDDAENIQVYSTSSDVTEPNDTMENAYPYNQLPIVNSEITGLYDLFGLGMRHASLDSEEDVDWYKVNLTAGVEYFVDLRNIGKTNWYIELYYYNSDGELSVFETTNPEIETKFEKWQEKYFDYTAEYTGTYYIKICNGGDWSDTLDYFFYVGPKKQTFNIVNMSTNNMVQFIGSTYKTYYFDLSGTALPKDATVINLSITDSFPKGSTCSEVQKYMSTGLKTYYATSSGTVSGIAGQPLGQVWILGARCQNGTHSTYWRGILNGRIECEMAPYPGNEI